MQARIGALLCASAFACGTWTRWLDDNSTQRKRWTVNMRKHYVIVGGLFDVRRVVFTLSIVWGRLALWCTRSRCIQMKYLWSNWALFFSVLISYPDHRLKLILTQWDRALQNLAGWALVWPSPPFFGMDAWAAPAWWQMAPCPGLATPAALPNKSTAVLMCPLTSANPVPTDRRLRRLWADCTNAG